MPSRGEAASEDETTARKTTKNQSDKWCRKRDSNPRPRHYETRIQRCQHQTPINDSEPFSQHSQIVRLIAFDIVSLAA